MIDHLLSHIARLDTGAYFVTAVTDKMGTEDPSQAVETFIYSKLKLIQEGCSSRKFVFADQGWRVVVTFFPKEEVVSERYALKNKVQYIHKHRIRE